MLRYAHTKSLKLILLFTRAFYKSEICTSVSVFRSIRLPKRFRRFGVNAKPKRILNYSFSPDSVVVQTPPMCKRSLSKRFQFKKSVLDVC